jgi:predicted site-specific integrase-resolvase
MPLTPADQVSPFGGSNPRPLLSARRVATRYGVHLGSIDRWVRFGKIPPPDVYVGRLRFWRPETLEEADRQNTIARVAAKAKPAANQINEDRGPPSAD